jgi:hypothetical protein
MTDDRELLELAAKACGFDTSHRWNAERLTLDPPVVALCIDGVSTGWNPLDDDGDALRLAISLGVLDLQWVIASALQAECTLVAQRAHVRRAIVKAAAMFAANVMYTPTGVQSATPSAGNSLTIQ